MNQICYYGDKISPHMAITPEGFLICKGVPIARTGYQHYLESELVEDGDPHKIVYVYRPKTEVFSTATLASFEGKPVTNGHPDVDVTPDNYLLYQKGHVQHVRLGTGEDANKILADLYITDKNLIDEIKNGKREVSAGYYAVDEEDDKGRLCQTRIRGNHVAVVDNGRAGSSVAIRDSQSVLQETKNMKLTNKKALARKVAKSLLNANSKNIDRVFLDAADVLVDEAEVGDEDVLDDDLVDEDVLDEELADDDFGDDDEVMDDDFGDDDFGDEDLEDDDFEGEGLADDDFGDEDVLDDDLVDEDLADDDFGDEDLEDEDEVLDDDFGDDDLEVEDACDEDLEDEDTCDEDIEDDDIEDEDVLDEEFGDDDLVAVDEEPEEAAAIGDAAIRRISRAAMQIRNRRDRQRVQDAILWAVSGKGSQMNDVMRMVRKNQKKRDQAAGNINTVSLQRSYDRLNPHKNHKR